MNQRLADRPTWKGQIVPFITGSTDKAYGQEGGVVGFGTTDALKFSEAITRKLCAACGQSLDYWLAFIGSEAEVEKGEFLYPAMHEDCARDMLELCPYFAGGEPGTLLLTDKVGMAMTRGYKMHTRREQHGVAPQVKVHIVAEKIKRVEWFDRDLVDPGKQNCDNDKQKAQPNEKETP